MTWDDEEDDEKIRLYGTSLFRIWEATTIEIDKLTYLQIVVE